MSYRLTIYLEEQTDDADLKGLISHCFELVFGLFILANKGGKESIKAKVGFIDEDEGLAEIEVILDNIPLDKTNAMYKLATGETLKEEISNNKYIYEYIRHIKVEEI